MKAGEDYAFEEIYMRYFAYIHNLAVKKTNDRSISLDICQDVFLSLYRSRGNIKTDNLKAYLHVLLKNNVINHYRHKMVEHKYLDHAAHFRKQFSLNEHTPRAVMETKELQNQIKVVIASLPEQCRRVFLLSREEGLTYQQIADALGISVNTVDQHIRKALRILREKLDYHLFIAVLVGLGLW